MAADSEDNVFVHPVCRLTDVAVHPAIGGIFASDGYENAAIYKYDTTGATSCRGTKALIVRRWPGLAAES